MDLFSSLVQVARGQLDDLIQTIVDEGAAGPARDQSRAPGRGPSDVADVPASLDPSVSHDTFRFIQRIVADRAYAKQLFLSYAKVAEVRSGARDGAPAPLTKEQSRHAKSMIQAIPAFDQLRFELSPSHMPDDRFWQVYFGLIADQHCLGAPKEGSEADLVAPKSSREEAARHTAAGDAPPSAPDSEAKEEVVTDEDLNKGVKRERDDDAQAQARAKAGFSDDLSIVSRLLYNGAKKTLQFAEQFIEAVDDHASSSLAAPTKGKQQQQPPPPPQQQEQEQQPTDTAARSSLLAASDAKRSRVSSTSASPLQNWPDEEASSLLDADEFSEEQLADGASGFDTDGLSVSSVEDADMRGWSRVRAGRKADKSGPGLEGQVDGFELV